jgi:hypothetical protein
MSTQYTIPLENICDLYRSINTGSFRVDSKNSNQNNSNQKNIDSKPAFAGLYFFAKKKSTHSLELKNILEKENSVSYEQFGNVEFFLYASANNAFHKETSYAQVIVKGKVFKKGLVLEQQNISSSVSFSADVDKLYSLLDTYAKK